MGDFNTMKTKFQLFSQLRGENIKIYKMMNVFSINSVGDGGFIL